MPLISERLRLRRQAEREAAGEVLWGEVISQEARVKIAQLWLDVVSYLNHNSSPLQQDPGSLLAGLVIQHVRRSTGTEPVCIEPQQLAQSKADTPALLDVFQALREALDLMAQRSRQLDALPAMYEESLNQILTAHRVSYKMINGEIVPFTDDPVYAATIEPTVRLLIDRRFEPAQAAFLNALREIQNRTPDDAITDAGSALQETLVELGCDGNTLGRLIADARRRDLLAGHDEKLVAGIVAFLEWVSADRSEKGDAHQHSDATIADAWLAVHVVGALIRRLASEDPRVLRTANSRR